MLGTDVALPASDRLAERLFHDLFDLASERRRFKWPNVDCSDDLDHQCTCRGERHARRGERHRRRAGRFVQYPEEQMPVTHRWMTKRRGFFDRGCQNTTTRISETLDHTTECTDRRNRPLSPALVSSVAYRAT